MKKTKKLGGGAKSLGTRLERKQRLNNEHPSEGTNGVVTEITSIDILKCRNTTPERERERERSSPSQPLEPEMLAFDW
jgi:hypothetical protein